MHFVKHGIFFLALLASLAITSYHKYYISNTQIEYVPEKQSVQIISRIFIDDFEKVLNERYDANLILDDKKNASVDFYIEKYLKQKFQISINTIPQNVKFLGKKIDMGLVKCYLEIEDVSDLAQLEVSNKVLFDVFTDQQNIIKLKVNATNKSFILTNENPKAVLNFN